MWGAALGGRDASPGASIGRMSRGMSNTCAMRAADALDMVRRALVEADEVMLVE